MLSHRQASVVYWICLLSLLILLAIAPRGITSSSVESTSGMEGNPSVELVPEQAIPEKSKISAKDRYSAPEIYAEGLTKSDWLFVVFYRYHFRIDLSLAPAFKATHINLSTKMPGQIVKTTNATSTDKGTATWKLKLGKKYEIEVGSRDIRWWLIVLTVLLLGGYVYSWFCLRRQEVKKDTEASDIIQKNNNPDF